MMILLKKITCALRNVPEWIIVLLMLFIYSLQVISTINIHSSNWDEPGYIAHGYYILKNGEFGRYATVTPLLVGEVASLPLLAFDLKDILSKDFIYDNNIGSEQILYLSRLMMFVFYIPLGIYIYIWSKELFGKKAAYFSLLLFTFSPNLIAHSKFVMHDLPAAALIFIATYHFYRLIKKPTYTRAFLSGLTFGLAQTTKYISLLLIPVFILASVIFILKKKQKSLQLISIKGLLRNIPVRRAFILVLIFCASSVLIISSTYLFIGTVKPISQSIEEDPIIDKTTYSTDTILDKINPLNIPFIDDSADFFLHHAPPVLPYDYLRGIFIQFLLNQRDIIDSYLLGMHSDEGWWYYYLIALLVKTPLPTLILTVLSIFALFRSRSVNIGLIFILVPVITILLFFTLIISEMGGLRHILSIYPFLFVLSGLSAARLYKHSGIVLMALLLWYVISSIMIYPYHFSYFNELAGGPENGHRILVENNLDIGQDIKGLSEYVKENRIKDIKVSFFATDPSYYRVEYEDLGSYPATQYTERPDCAPAKGLIAISATNLKGVFFENHSCFSWLEDNYKPIHKIGYSVFIYNITG